MALIYPVPSNIHVLNFTVGIYLGNAKHHKYKVYVTSISDLELRKIESSFSDAESLAKQLFMFLFKEELATRPEAVCCTKNGGEWEILDQNILNGIRCKYWFSVLSVWAHPLSICILSINWDTVEPRLSETFILALVNGIHEQLQ